MAGQSWSRRWPVYEVLLPWQQCGAVGVVLKLCVCLPLSVGESSAENGNLLKQRGTNQNRLIQNNPFERLKLELSISE